MIREIVIIDESKCDGCGLCVPACHEGALNIINGKARIVADRLCDGMGACLGHCPRGAIRIERRDADVFDEAAATAHAHHLPPTAGSTPHNHRPRPAPPSAHPAHDGGCPGSRLMQFAPPVAKAGDAPASTSAESELSHWPVQLRLLSPEAPVLKGARLLVAADCVPVAYAEFQSRLLRNRAVVVGCPKFDDLPGYVDKLTHIIHANELREIVVARMEVPCCGGILHAVLEARQRAASDVPVIDAVIGIRGQLLAWQPVPTGSGSAK